MKVNKKLLLITLILLILELIIALFVKDAVVRPYLGDILVVILIYTFIRTFDQNKIKGLPFYIFFIAVMIEVSQLFNLVKLLGLKDHKLASIVLGSTFDWMDIICYSVGVVLLLIYEMTARRREAIERRKRQARRSRTRISPEEKIRIVKNIVIKALAIGAMIIGVTAIVIYFINLHVIRKYDQNIIGIEEAVDIDMDCIMVLGAGVWVGGKPSPILDDRLSKGIELYEAGGSDRLLMSGDHGRVDYDEVNVMKAVAIDASIEGDHIFMDHAGFSTYESMVRAKEVFEVETMVIVTQKYHLYRALYIANEVGITAYGVEAENIEYPGDKQRSFREVFARTKDFVYTIIMPEPTFLGEVIPISGSGNQTDD